MATLIKAITDLDTILMFTEDASFPQSNGVILVGTEQIAYSENYMGTLYGCQRGYNSTTAASHSVAAVISLVDYFSSPTVQTQSYSGTHSYQAISSDLTLSATAGSNTGSNPKYLASAMFNLFGATLTNAANYLAGVIGAYSITGSLTSTYPAGAVLAQVTDGVTAVDGAVVAYVDGDSAVTTANAAFKAMCNNSNAGSGFNYGLDLYSASHDGFLELAILKADIRMSNQVCVLNGAGVPSSAGTGFAAKGSLYVDTTNGKLYINGGTAGTPSWKLVTSA